MAGPGTGPDGRRWRRLLPTLSGVVLFAIALAAGCLFETTDRAARLETLRAEVARDLAAARGRLDAAINANLLVASALAGQIGPDLDAERFAALTAPLLGQHSQVRALALVDGDGMVRFSQPEVTALGGAGADISRRPDQWEPARLAARRSQPVVAGPLRGLDGKPRVVAWMPMTAPATPAGGAFVRATIDLDALFAKAGLSGTLPLRVAVRNDPALASSGWGDGQAFFGDPAVFADHPVLLPGGELPAAAWQLGGIPAGGWPLLEERTWTIRGIALFAGLVLGALAFTVVGAVSARSTAETWDGNPSGYDAMTGLPSRALFLRSAREAMLEAQRRGRGAAIMLIGIDRFGALATLQGPATLAVAVRAVGQGCEAGLRPDDLLGYLGDGIFAALLLGIGADAALIAAERVRRSVGSIRVDGAETGGGDALPLVLSVSIGCALAEEQDSEPLNALGRAEQRLREALADGPGQIVV